MTTGAKFCTLPLKSLLGFGDLNDRFLQYLKKNSIDATKARWDVDGVFQTKLSLASAGVSKFSITGTSRSTDGVGNILDITQIHGGDVLYQSSLFENALGTTYYVGLKYAEVPDGVRINPRSGKPEYIAMREEIGVAAAPNAVALVGSTLVFTVDSVTEAAVSNAGRYVQVYKNVPGDLVTSDLAALPAPLAVSWTGSNNKITTTLLGQSTPSVVASDYTVVLIGPAVKKNTDLRTAPGYAFLSTVVGAGATNPPGAFDNSAQQLLVTFEDADIVRAELEAYEASVLSNALPGAALVGVAPSSYNTRIPIQGATFRSSVGLGNQLDGSLPANARLTDVLVAIDRQLSRVRAWSATITGAAVSTVAEIISGAVGDAARTGGAYFLKKGGTLLADGAFAASVAPKFSGESSAVGAGDYAGTWSRSKLNFDRGSSRNSLPPGLYERLMLGSANATHAMSLGGLGVTPGGTIRDSVVVGTQFDVDGSDPALGYTPFHFADTVFDPGPATPSANISGATLSFGGGASNLPTHGTVENCVILGPTSSQTSPAPTAALYIQSGLGAPSGLATALDANPVTGGNQDRPLIFRNCVFLAQRNDIPVIRLASKQKVTFINCYIYGKSGQTVPLIVCDGGQNLEMLGCMMFAPEGQFFSGSNVLGNIENLTMVAGTGTAVSTPIAFEASGSTTRQLSLRNVVLLANTACIRASSASPKTAPMVKLGRSGTTNGAINVDGFQIFYPVGSNVHGAETLLMYGGAAKSKFSNIYIDFNQNVAPDQAQNNTGITWTGPSGVLVGCLGLFNGVAPQFRPNCQNITIAQLRNPTFTPATAVFGCNGAEVRDLEIELSYNSGDGQYYAWVHLESGNDVTNFKTIGASVNPLFALFNVNGNSNVVNGLHIGGTEGSNPATLGGSTPPSALVRFNGNDNELKGLRLTATGSSWSFLVWLIGRANVNSGWRVNSLSTPSTEMVRMDTLDTTIENSVFRWDATARRAIILEPGALTNLISNNIFSKSTGSTPAIQDAGTGNVITPNVEH